MSEHACLLAVSARTPVGAGSAASAAAVRAGMALFKNHPFMVDAKGQSMVVARDTFLPVEMAVADRLAVLGTSALQEAVSALKGVDPARLPAISVLAGLPEPRPGLPEHLVAELSPRLQHALGAPCRVSGVAASQHGHAAGLLAVGSALARIRAGSDELFLAGGIDSWLEPETLEWLDASGQLHALSNTWGFIPGEAAAFCLLAGKSTAKRLGFEPLQWVGAFGMTREHNLIKTDTVCLGHGMTEAIRQAAAGLPAGQRVDQGYGDINGEPYRGDELGYAIVRTSEHFVAPGDFITPADCWGDIGAASGPAYVALASIAATRGYAKGPRAMTLASSEGGARAALLLHTPLAR